MKNFALLVLLLATVVACQTVSPEQEKAAVETSLNEFFKSMEAFDYDGMRSLCTPDFSLFETGFDHKDLDGFIEAVKSMEGAGISVGLDIQKTEVVGNMALVILNFSANIAMGDVKMDIEAYENYIFRKENNKWLMHYCHSTHLPDKSNKNLTSLHLLKVPDELQINELQIAVNKFNLAISEMGYMDCGYKIMQVIPGKDSNYNYFLKGTWKNQETYDVIHNSDAYKNVSDNMPESINKFFENQVYAKVKDM
uniref:YybH family protein n=1 Tax=uncultured Draconibacterium sp. TaxID=1573823 RepID=UPI00321670C3